jgi:pimeloyl-ACP methyl ester carboxylesterase
MTLANGDLVVVVPGVLGSKLERHGKTIWGHRHLIANVHRLVEVLTRELALPAGALDSPCDAIDDGVSATDIMKLPSLIPGFASTDGYNKLIDALTRRAEATPARVVAFPYDWRQSSVVSAHALRKFVHARLSEQRERIASARTILIAHSMGGLVARYFAERLDDDSLVRSIVCVGTPFLGAVDALEVAVNGNVELGPFRVDLTELAHTFPSLAELLPRYPCVRTGGEPLRIDGLDSAVALDPRLLRHNQYFHDILASAPLAGVDPRYHVLLSYGQTTRTLCSLTSDGRLRPAEATDFGEGDGRVPRLSAFLPDWEDDSDATFLGGRHATFHQQRSCYIHLGGVLTASKRRSQGVDEQLDVACVPATIPGATFEIVARTDPSSPQVILRLRVTDTLNDELAAEAFLRRQTDGSYRTSLALDVPGLFRWTVDSSPHGSSSVTPVSDLLLCAHS